MSQYDFYDWQRHPSGLLVARDFWGEPTATNVTSQPAAVLTAEEWAAFRRHWRQILPLRTMDPPLWQPDLTPPQPDLTREVEAEAPFLRLPVEKLPEETW